MRLVGKAEIDAGADSMPGKEFRVLVRRLVLAIGVLATQAIAGEFNPKLNVGDAAPAWSNLEGVDGKRHSLRDLAGRDVVVVVFTCNSCPAARDYEDRIIELARNHADSSSRVAVVAINSNTIEADRLPRMKERAEQRRFPFPYLFDETQEVAKAFGATFTPEFFVLNKERKVVYMGAMDDSSKAEDVKVRFVELAIAAALEGKLPTKTETLARGCRVRYNRVRRG